MVQVRSVKAREVLDSRGNPTVEVDMETKDGAFRSIVPSGASAGSHEALEMRDGGSRFMGNGVQNAVRNVNTRILDRIRGKDFGSVEELDKALIELDGTENKSGLGANATLPVSMCFTQALARNQGMHLFEFIGSVTGCDASTMPVPQLNILNGGKHAGQENDIQEHMIMPVGAKTYAEAIRMSCETYHALKKILKSKFGSRGTLVGDEGGFVPPIDNVNDRLEIIQKAIENAGYDGKIVFAIDSASSEFFSKGVYTVGKKHMSPSQMADFYEGLAKSFPIVSLEDGMAEDDWDGWQELTSRIGGAVQIVGDDLFVTSTKRIQKGIEMKAANSVLIKVNQIGTVTETLEAIRMAKENGWTAVVSHRSGETEDSFIADLVVGVNAGQSKFGGPARSDRNAKYNQLLRIEEMLGPKARYPGENFRGSVQ